jgi:glycosyltransferase involved in cell wall biosynthesis
VHPGSRNSLRETSVLHLTASPSFGGPERQMLGLGAALAGKVCSRYLSFSEEGRSTAFLQAAESAGFAATGLSSDWPRVTRMYRELASVVKSSNAEILMCHGYKARIFGRFVAARSGIPVVGVLRGWTAETRTVRCYEWLDRRLLRKLDHIVCVSQSQARHALSFGVSPEKLTVIHNAIDIGRFKGRDPQKRAELLSNFASPRRLIVAAVGRISPEKGFCTLVRVASRVVARHPETGFLIFGDGPLRAQLQRDICAAGLQDHVKIAGFRTDLDACFPHFDLLILPSYSEGLPNVVLEAFAAGVPVVATAVGGVPEVVQDGLSGFLVTAGDDVAMAERISEMARNDGLRRSMAAHGHGRVSREFSFTTQARSYEQLFCKMTPRSATETSQLGVTDNDRVMAAIRG